MPKPVTASQPAEEEAESGSKRRYHADSSKLPLVSRIDDAITMEEAADLLREANELVDIKTTAVARLAAIQTRLIEIADAFSLPGMRFGRIGFYYGGEKTRSSLDKRKLIENGVDPELIAACYSDSKPFPDARFIPFL